MFLYFLIERNLIEIYSINAFDATSRDYLIFVSIWLMIYFLIRRFFEVLFNNNAEEDNISLNFNKDVRVIIQTKVVAKFMKKFEPFIKKCSLKTSSVFKLIILCAIFLIQFT